MGSVLEVVPAHTATVPGPEAARKTLMRLCGQVTMSGGRSKVQSKGPVPHSPQQEHPDTQRPQ